jgi:hypothetical protein
MPWIFHKTLNKLFHDFPKPSKYYGKFLLIDANMLRHTASTVCKPLEIIFNCSLQTDRFPQMWKSATIIALFKKGIKSDPTNYRPMSLQICVGKVFERMIFKYI